VVRVCLRVSFGLGDGRLVGGIRASVEAGLAVDKVSRHGGIPLGAAYALANDASESPAPQRSADPRAGAPPDFAPRDRHIAFGRSRGPPVSSQPMPAIVEVSLDITRIEGPGVDPVSAEYVVTFWLLPMGRAGAIQLARVRGLDALTDVLRQSGVPTREIEAAWRILAIQPTHQISRVRLTRALIRRLTRDLIRRLGL